jgi:hypothetical protein
MNLNKNIPGLFTPKMKSSYEKIFNEFSKVENSIKEFHIAKKDCDEKRRNRVKMLEIKLQGFSEEVKAVNFSSLQRQLEDLNHTINLNKDEISVEKSSKALIRTDFMKKEIKNFEDNSSQMENKESVLINQILNLNATKGDDMIQFIESLLLKTSSEIQTDTVRNLNSK